MHARPAVWHRAPRSSACRRLTPHPARARRTARSSSACGRPAQPSWPMVGGVAAACLGAVPTHWPLWGYRRSGGMHDCMRACWTGITASHQDACNTPRAPPPPAASHYVCAETPNTREVLITLPSRDPYHFSFDDVLQEETGQGEVFESEPAAAGCHAPRACLVAARRLAQPGMPCVRLIACPCTHTPQRWAPRSWTTACRGTTPPSSPTARPARARPSP